MLCFSLRHAWRFLQFVSEISLNGGFRGIIAQTWIRCRYSNSGQEKKSKRRYGERDTRIAENKTLDHAVSGRQLWLAAWRSVINDQEIVRRRLRGH